MKTLNALVICLLAVVLVFSGVQAQVLLKSIPVAAGLQLANSATNTSNAVSVFNASNSTYPLFNGQVPDSIRIRWFSTADSLTRVFINYRASVGASGLYTSVNLDSIKAATVIASQGSHTIPITAWLGYDILKVLLTAQATGNAVITSHASKLYVWLDFYYHVANR